ncbi:MAG: GtrA family protein [Streptosporangiaceae bacterium]
MRIIRDLYARFQVLIHEVAKFGIVGSLAFVLTLILVNAFHSGAGLGEITATTLANVLATVFAFVGNKFWAFRHRKGSHWGRETLLFFFFNGIGILITDGVVWLVHSGIGLTDNYSYNVANIIGIGLATLFRLYCYRRWVFLYAEGEAPAAEQLEPETSGAPERLSAAADPQREVSGFQDALHHLRQVMLDRVQVHRVLQPDRERGYGLVGVVAGPVEPPVHGALDPPP